MCNSQKGIHYDLPYVVVETDPRREDYETCTVYLYDIPDYTDFQVGDFIAVTFRVFGIKVAEAISIQ